MNLQSLDDLRQLIVELKLAVSEENNLREEIFADQKPLSDRKLLGGKNKNRMDRYKWNAYMKAYRTRKKEVV